MDPLSSNNDLTEPNPFTLSPKASRGIGNSYAISKLEDQHRSEEVNTLNSLYGKIKHQTLNKVEKVSSTLQEVSAQWVSVKRGHLFSFQHKQHNRLF